MIQFWKEVNMLLISLNLFNLWNRNLFSILLQRSMPFPLQKENKYWLNWQFFFKWSKNLLTSPPQICPLLMGFLRMRPASSSPTFIQSWKQAEKVKARLLKFALSLFFFNGRCSLKTKVVEQKQLWTWTHFSRNLYQQCLCPVRCNVGRGQTSEVRTYFFLRCWGSTILATHCLVKWLNTWGKRVVSWHRQVNDFFFFSHQVPRWTIALDPPRLSVLCTPNVFKSLFNLYSS